MRLWQNDVIPLATIDFDEGISKVKIDGRDVYYKEKHVGVIEADFEEGAIFVTRRMYADEKGNLVHWFEKEHGLLFSVPVISAVREHGAKYLGIIFFYKGKTRRFRKEMTEVIHWPMYDGRGHGDDWQYVFSFDPENTNYDYATPKWLL